MFDTIVECPDPRLIVTIEYVENEHERITKTFDYGTLVYQTDTKTLYGFEHDVWYVLCCRENASDAALEKPSEAPPTKKRKIC